MSTVAWQSSPVKEVVRKISTVNKKIKQKETLAEGSFPVIDQGQDYIAGYFNDPSKVIDDGPVIVFGDHTKSIKYVDFPFVPGADGTKVLQPNSELFIPKLFYYFLHCIKFPDKGYARHFQHLEKETINIPPISEQQKIVAKIEELLSELDSSSSAINTAIKARKTYLQSVLKKLYTPQADWTEIKSEKLFSYVTSGSRGWAKYYSDDADKPYFLRVTNVNYETIDLDLRAEKLKYVDLPETVEGRRTLVQPGDILISITGYVGMIGVVPVDIPEAYISQHISLARPISEINSKYLAYYLISKTGGLRQLELLQKGATKAGLTLGDIKNVMFPVAPRDEQDRIVDTIDQIMSEVAALHRELTSLRQQSISLKQSILSKAFKGELV